MIVSYQDNLGMDQNFGKNIEKITLRKIITSVPDCIIRILNLDIYMDASFEKFCTDEHIVPGGGMDIRR